MSRPTQPKLKAHHCYRSWTSTWYDDEGAHRTKRFGKEREITARQARARFDHWLQTAFNVFDHVRNPESMAAQYTVNRLADDYLEHAKTIYRKDGELTTYVSNVDSAMKALKAHHGIALAADFRAHQLAQLRDAMIWSRDGEGAAKALAVKTVNGRLYCVKEAFRWASAEKGIIPEQTALALQMVRPLDKAGLTPKTPCPCGPCRKTRYGRRRSIVRRRSER